MTEQREPASAAPDKTLALAAETKALAEIKENIADIDAKQEKIERRTPFFFTGFLGGIGSLVMISATMPAGSVVTGAAMSVAGAVLGGSIVVGLVNDFRSQKLDQKRNAKRFEQKKKEADLRERLELDYAARVQAVAEPLFRAAAARADLSAGEIIFFPDPENPAQDLVLQIAEIHDCVDGADGEAKFTQQILAHVGKPVDGAELGQASRIPRLPAFEQERPAPTPMDILKIEAYKAQQTAPHTSPSRPDGFQAQSQQAQPPSSAIPK